MSRLFLFCVVACGCSQTPPATQTSSHSIAEAASGNTLNRQDSVFTDQHGGKWSATPLNAAYGFPAAKLPASQAKFFERIDHYTTTISKMSFKNQRALETFNQTTRQQQLLVFKELFDCPDFDDWVGQVYFDRLGITFTTGLGWSWSHRPPTQTTFGDGAYTARTLATLFFSDTSADLSDFTDGEWVRIKVDVKGEFKRKVVMLANDQWYYFGTDPTIRGALDGDKVRAITSNCYFSRGLFLRDLRHLRD